MKPLYIVFIFSLAYLFLGNIGREKIVIPDDSIRFRVIANSNSEQDQIIKKEIVKSLSKEIITPNIKNINEERIFLKENLPKFTKTVKKTLADNNYSSKFDINYGKNYFPEKTYRNITYPEGEYESLVVTIGNGQGKNFWCVLFPPLCLIDEDTESYPSLIKEIINKYF